MRKRHKPMRFFPGKNPCDCCIHRPDCDWICWHRARWWDSQMEKIRERMKKPSPGGEGLVKSES